MPIDFSKFQKKIPDSQEKIIPGENDQNVANIQSEKKAKTDSNISANKENSKIEASSSRKTQVENKRGTYSQKIDQKISDIDLRIEKKFNEFNERLLKLVNLGLKHELNIENLIKYIKSHKKKTKLYKLADYFSENNLVDIEKMLKYLYNTGVIKRYKNNWYGLK